MFHLPAQIQNSAVFIRVVQGFDEYMNLVLDQALRSHQLIMKEQQKSCEFSLSLSTLFFFFFFSLFKKKSFNFSFYTEVNEEQAVSSGIGIDTLPQFFFFSIV